MPTARALNSFRPEADPPFDVLIVDEASQIGLEALPLLALARNTIVVGDDKQTSPEHVGLDRQQVFTSLLGLCVGLSLAFSLDPVFGRSLEEHCC